MKSYQATSLIEAPPERVWEVLVDTAGYPTWDSGVVRVDGRVAPGEKLKLVSELNPGRTFPLKVAEVVPAQRMAWTGGMPLGLFRGVRTFTLAPEAGGTRFVLREEFTGPLLPLIWKSMPDMGPSFEKFATGLKRRAENGA